MPFARALVCKPICTGMHGVANAAHGPTGPNAGASHGTDDETLRAIAPSPILVAWTVCAGPFAPVTIETGPAVALLRRSFGAAFDLPTARKKRMKTGKR